MKEDVSTFSDAGTAADADRSLADDLRQLAEDGKVLARAEAAYQKARAAYLGEQARGIAIRGALAAALVLFALMALALGLVLGLAPMLTIWGATAVVVGGFLLVAFVLAGSASAKWRRMVRMLGSDETGR
jgi:hypothetical protein